MKATSSITICLSLATLLCSCTTTGDPRAGGFFGWSREKAEARQKNLISHQEALQQELSEVEKVSEDLTVKRNRLQREIKNLKNKLKETQNIAERDFLLKKIKEREEELYSSGF